MTKIAMFLCATILLLLIAGCSGTTTGTYSEQSFLGTWSTTDSGTNATVTVVIALANAANTNGPTTATTNISVTDANAPGGVYTTTTAIPVPRIQIDSTDYVYYASYTPPGTNYNFVINISPSNTTGVMNVQYSVTINGQTAPIVNSGVFSLTRVSSSTTSAK